LAIIEIQSLTKKFKNFTAVDDLSLTVEKGEIFGFLGPNGAGKSTTIRMMLSLIKQDKGNIFLFDKNLETSDRSIFSKIGALVEKPDFYLYLTAFKNLEIFARLSGTDASRVRILEMLDIVGLKGREFDKVKTYSLGMKQRLGLAQALIHKPELIILDEPTNGLDPQGMKEVKDLLMHLSKTESLTIFLSSHILREVETMATSMAIINKGKTAVQGNVSNLLNQGKTKLTIETLNGDENYANIKERFGEKVLSINKNNIEMEAEFNDVPNLIREISNTDLNILSITPLRSLEDYFLKITGA